MNLNNIASEFWEELSRKMVLSNLEHIDTCCDPSCSAGKRGLRRENVVMIEDRRTEWKIGAGDML
jgi:hypothetical protein